MLTILLIVTIGETLLSLFDPTVDEIKRPELWVATGAALAILAVAGLLATRPPGSLGKLDQRHAQFALFRRQDHATPPARAGMMLTSSPSFTRVPRPAVSSMASPLT